MAGHGVVRDMGETLVALLQAALHGLVVPEDVRVATPDSFHELEPTSRPTCTIFLYRVAVNSVMRNTDRGWYSAAVPPAGHCCPSTCHI
jgi:hypothetical protein